MIKSIADIPSIIYHGTSSNFHDSLVSKIQLNQNHSPTDFGDGFYTTTVYEQSRNFAIKKSALRQNRYPGCQPMIVALHLDTNILSTCHGKIFDTPDQQWKEFIFNNRLGRNFIISSLHNLDMSFDYVLEQSQTQTSYKCAAWLVIVSLVQTILSIKFKRCITVTPTNYRSTHQQH